MHNETSLICLTAPHLSIVFDIEEYSAMDSFK